MAILDEKERERQYLGNVRGLVAILVEIPSWLQFVRKSLNVTIWVKLARTIFIYFDLPMASSVFGLWSSV